MSAARKASWADPVKRAQRLAKMKAVMADPEVQAKRREQLRKALASPETRAKRAAALRKIPLEVIAEARRRRELGELPADIARTLGLKASQLYKAFAGVVPKGSQTACPYGHAYEGENLRVYTGGGRFEHRYCGACFRQRQRPVESLFCHCRHHHSEHRYGMCCALNAQRDVCGCSEFFPSNRRRSGDEVVGADVYAYPLRVSLDAEMVASSWEGGRYLSDRYSYAESIPNYVSFTFPSMDDEVVECLTDDVLRWVQLGYIRFSVMQAHNWSRPARSGTEKRVA